MHEAMTWKAGRYTLFDVNERPVAEVCKVKGGWCWYVIGADMSGDVETCSGAMSAVEGVLGLRSARVTNPQRQDVP